MGREHDAQEQGRKLLKLNPRFSTARYLRTPGYKDQSLNERSARVLRQAGLPFEFESLGEQKLKGFDQPVRAFAVQLKSGEKIPELEQTAVIPVFGMDDEDERPPLELPDKPSIAVLPFLNMSGDPEQDYFSDGITEDIITELSRFHEIFVIARNSSFTFKGKSVDVSEVASKLGIQFVVEGSVRKAAGRVRITVQLIDATTGSHIWADRFDRLLEDIFVVQDEVVAAIVSTLPSQIRQADLARPNRQLADIRAYDLVLQASQTLSTLAGVESAITLLTQALDIEPEYALAHALLANALNLLSRYQLILRTDASKIEIMNHARRAIVLDPSDHRVYQCLSETCLFVEPDLVEARIHAERALELNPNSTVTAAWMGYIHNCYGETELAKELCARAIRLDPLANAWVKFLQGVIYFDAGEIDLAIGMFLASAWEEKWPHLMAAYALSGQIDRAREIAMRTRKEWSDINPEDLDERIQKIMCGGWYTHGNHDGSFINGLRLAGLIA
jgi:adenylate cyclase